MSAVEAMYDLSYLVSKVNVKAVSHLLEQSLHFPRDTVEDCMLKLYQEKLNFKLIELEAHQLKNACTRNDTVLCLQLLQKLYDEQGWELLDAIQIQRHGIPVLYVKLENCSGRIMTLEVDDFRYALQSYLRRAEEESQCRWKKVAVMAFLGTALTAGVIAFLKRRDDE